MRVDGVVLGDWVNLESQCQGMRGSLEMGYISTKAGSPLFGRLVVDTLFVCVSRIRGQSLGGTWYSSQYLQRRVSKKMFTDIDFIRILTAKQNCRENTITA